MASRNVLQGAAMGGEASAIGGRYRSGLPESKLVATFRVLKLRPARERKFFLRCINNLEESAFGAGARITGDRALNVIWIREKIAEKNDARPGAHLSRGRF